MKTRTIEIEEKNYTITCEVKRDGTVVEAIMRVDHLEDHPHDCTIGVRESKHFMDKVQQEVDAIDWSDDGDSGHEEYCDALSIIKSGLRP